MSKRSERAHYSAGPTARVRCETCGSEFEKTLTMIRKTKRNFCSRKCFGESRKNNPEKFWAKVKKEPNACWIWTGSGNPDGYGIVSVSNSRMSTHRYSYELAFGKIPEGLHVLHKCDNPPCVNPAHLFLGTNADNMEDKNVKDRAGLKLKTKDVHAIIDACKSGCTQRSVAKQFGVSPSHVSKLCSGLGKIASAYVNDSRES